MAEWGRKGYSKAWPSRTPVWTWTAVLLTFVFFAGMLTLQYERSWSAAERLYLTDYLKSGARGKTSATASTKYTLLEAVVGPNQKQGQRLVIGDEIEEVPSLDGRPGSRLTDEGVKNGIVRVTWVTRVFNDRGLHRVMSEAVYCNIGCWDFYQKPVYLSLAFFVLALFVAVPNDRVRRMLYKHGRRLRGPEVVTTAERRVRSPYLDPAAGCCCFFSYPRVSAKPWQARLFRQSSSSLLPLCGSCSSPQAGSRSCFVVNHVFAVEPA